MTPPTDRIVETRARELAERLQARGWRLAVAESLTGGLLSAAVASAPDAGKWFRGGVVAYQPEVKFGLLRISQGPVVSERCAREMATGVKDLFDAEVGLSVTGVGGPDPEEGQEAGTVWVAVRARENEMSELGRFADKPPKEVCSLSCEFALDLALRALQS